MLGIIDKANDWVGKIMSFGLIVMMCIMVFELVRRDAFDSPTVWAWQVNGLLFSGVLVLGGGYVLLHRGHVRLDIIYERLSYRGKLIADTVTFPIFLIFLSIVVWQGWEMAFSSLSKQERLLGFFPAPVYPTKIAFFVAAALLLLQGIAIFMRNIIAIMEKNKKDSHSVSNT